MGIINFSKRYKVAKSNFEPENLPSNRKAQFFDLLKNRFTTLLLMGLFLLLSSIPLIFVMILRENYLFVANDTLKGDELIAARISVELIYSALLIVCFLIIALVGAGIMKVFIRLIWAEPIFLKHDIGTGIKQNIGTFLLVAFFIGLFNLISVVIDIFVATDSNYLGYIPSIINFVFIFPVLLNSLFVCSIYKNSFFKTIKLSFQLIMKKFFIIIGCCFLAYLLILILQISYLVIRLIVFSVAIVAVLPVFLLLFWEIEMSIFDNLINVKDYPSFYRKGLYTKPAESIKKSDTN